MDDEFIPAGVVTRYLANHGYVAVPREEYERLVAPLAQDEPTCPYPLHREKFGWSHRLYFANIGGTSDDPMSGMNAVRCEACGNVSFEQPIALA